MVNNSRKYFQSIDLTQLRFHTGDVYGLIATRVILGFVQGPAFPSFAAFIVPWYPVEQRGSLCSIGYIGVSVRKFQLIPLNVSVKTQFIGRRCSSGSSIWIDNTSYWTMGHCFLFHYRDFDCLGDFICKLLVNTNTRLIFNVQNLFGRYSHFRHSFVMNNHKIIHLSMKWNENICNKKSWTMKMSARIYLHYLG